MACSSIIPWGKGADQRHNLLLPAPWNGEKEIISQGQRDSVT